MAGQKRLHLYFDPAIDAGLPRMLKAAFGRLHVEIADGDAAHIDPESPGVLAVITSADGEGCFRARRRRQRRCPT
jgi:hypothetical protein